MSGALRVGIAGYGLAGEVFHAPLVAATARTRGRGRDDVDPERAARARAAYPGIEVAGSPTAAARHRRDRPARRRRAEPAHVPLARAALAAGSRSSWTSRSPPTWRGGRLVDDFAAAGVPLTVFQNRRLDGDFLTLRRIVESGELGEVDPPRVALRALPAGGERRRWRERPDAARAAACCSTSARTSSTRR